MKITIDIPGSYAGEEIVKMNIIVFKRLDEYFKEPQNRHPMKDLMFSVENPKWNNYSATQKIYEESEMNILVTVKFD